MRAGTALLLLLALGTLSACGFQPVYGDYSAASTNSAALQQVQLRPLPDRLGQQLTNKLIDRFYTTGRAQKPRYQLELSLQPQERDLGIQRDATATRGELLLTAQLAIYETATEAELYRTTVRTRVAYNILEGQYGNLAARENAYDRALDDVANEIVSRTALFLNRAASEGAEGPEHIEAE